jgi:hypothetical protein
MRRSSSSAENGSFEPALSALDRAGTEHRRTPSLWVVSEAVTTVLRGQASEGSASQTVVEGLAVGTVAVGVIRKSERRQNLYAACRDGQWLEPCMLMDGGSSADSTEALGDLGTGLMTAGWNSADCS